VTIYNDNIHTVNLARADKVWPKAQHLAPAHAQVRSACKERAIRVCHVRRQDNRAHKLAHSTLKQALASRCDTADTTQND
jgi:hypothetical protein